MYHPKCGIGCVRKPTKIVPKYNKTKKTIFDKMTESIALRLLVEFKKAIQPKIIATNCINKTRAKEIITAVLLLQVNSNRI